MRPRVKRVEKRLEIAKKKFSVDTRQSQVGNLNQIYVHALAQR